VVVAGGGALERVLLQHGHGAQLLLLVVGVLAVGIAAALRGVVLLHLDAAGAGLDSAQVVGARGRRHDRRLEGVGEQRLQLARR